MQCVGLPDFLPLHEVSQSLLETVRLMKVSCDQVIREAGIGLEAAIRERLPDTAGFFVPRPLSIQMESGPFVASVAYGLAHQQTAEGPVVQIHPVLIVGIYYLTLNEVGRELVLAKEWYSLEGLSILSRYNGFKRGLSLQEADRTVDSRQLRIETEAYGLAKVCQAYKRAREIAVKEQGANPEHPFLLQQYGRIYTDSELEKFHPNALRAIELALTYIEELQGLEGETSFSDSTSEVVVEFAASWWNAYVKKIEELFSKGVHEQISQTFQS